MPEGLVKSSLMISLTHKQKWLKLASCMAVCAAAIGCGVDPGRVLGGDPRMLTIPGPEKIATGEVVEGSYIVTFRDQTPSYALGFPDFVSEFRHHYRYLYSSYLADPRVRDIQYITSVNLANPGSKRWRAEFDPPRALRLVWNRDSVDPAMGTLARVDFRSAGAAREVLGKWADNGRIWFAEPNRVNRLQGAFGDLRKDYESWNVSWYGDINLTQAFAAIESRDPATSPSDEEMYANPPVIAVLDSGTDIKHPAFQDHLWENPKAGQNSGCGKDIYGCDTTKAKKGRLGSPKVLPYAFDEERGCPSAEQNENANTNCTHGTHVAGTIASQMEGFGGVCPVCQIMTVKIIEEVDGKGAALDSAILNGFKYLAQFEQEEKSVVRVINSSFGKYTRSRAVSLLVSILTSSLDVLVVGAAGNEDSMSRVYPAALDDALAVSAVCGTSFPSRARGKIPTSCGNENQSYKKAKFSNFGPWVDVAAPGVAVTSIEAGTQSEKSIKNGTSMAAPVVSGVAGLVLAANPNMGVSSLKRRIVQTANPVIYDKDEQRFNYNYYYAKIPGESSKRPLLGAGIIDAAAAVAGNDQRGVTTGKLRRVDGGCGTVGVASDGSAWAIMLILLVAPLCVGASSMRRRADSSRS